MPVVMFVVLCAAIELPYRSRGRFIKEKIEVDPFNVVQAGLLTLASFVLGLSFAQASDRFDSRRALVVKEANAIGTTWLRAGQLEPAQKVLFRRTLTDYTASRLAAYGTKRTDLANGMTDWQRQSVEKTARDQDALWAVASNALRAHPANLGLSLLMETLNDTIDVSAEQVQALTHHVPTAVVVLTLALVTVSSLSLGVRFAFEGYRPLAISLIYVVANVLVIWMMIDYDRPQAGFVKVDLTPMRSQLQSMQQAPPD